MAASTVEDVERVARLLEEEERAERSREEEGGWTASSIYAFMRRLDEEAPVQADVIRRAAELGGSISREEVYRIGGFGEERSIRGFTTPVRRITREFQDRGLLSRELPELLITDYDKGTPFGPVVGFLIPADAVPLIPTPNGPKLSEGVHAGAHEMREAQ